MANIRRPVLFCGSILFLVVNLLWMGIPRSVNAQDDSLAQILNPRVQSPSTVINAQGLGNTLAGTLITAQSLANGVLQNCNPTSNQATLTITKAVNNPSQIITVPDLNTLQFGVTVLNNGNTLTSGSTLLLRNGDSVRLCISPGSLIVTETNTPSNFNFVTSFASAGTTPIRTTGSSCIASNILAGENVTCAITNSLQSGPTSSTTTNSSLPLIVTPRSGNAIQTQTKTGTVIAAQGLANPSTTTDNPNVCGTGQLCPTNGDIPRNPPFQVCATNEGVGVQQVKGLTTQQSSVARTTTRVPSALTIVLRGHADLDSLKNQLRYWGTSTVSVVLKSDLNQEDGILTAIANPRLEGEIIVQNKDGAKQKVFSYLLTDVRTECKYITLGEAFGPAPNANVVPLGHMGQVEGKHITAPPITKELLGGVIVATTPPFKVLPSVLNPPFATCQTDQTKGQGAVSDNLALYIIKGDVDIRSISGNTLTVELTADIQPSDTDLAKIVKDQQNGFAANNPYLVANLIANEENINSAHKIDFALTDVNTDCKQVSLNTQSIFRPFANELNP